jgi:hypothetical protein
MALARFVDKAAVGDIAVRHVRGLWWHLLEPHVLAEMIDDWHVGFPPQSCELFGRVPDFSVQLLMYA